MTAQSRQAEAFRDDALTRERRVAVNEQRQHRSPVATGTALLILLRAHLTEHDRIDDFEMRGVRRQREMHAVAVEHAVRRCAEVIFDVAGTFDVVGLE